MQKRVTPEGCLNLFRRRVYLDRALRDKVVTCYETVEGLEVWGTSTGSICYGSIGVAEPVLVELGEGVPEDLRFEQYSPPVCPWIAVA